MAHVQKLSTLSCVSSNPPEHPFFDHLFVRTNILWLMYWKPLKSINFCRPLSSTNLKAKNAISWCHGSIEKLPHILLTGLSDLTPPHPPHTHTQCIFNMPWFMTFLCCEIIKFQKTASTLERVIWGKLNLYPQEVTQNGSRTNYLLFPLNKSYVDLGFFFSSAYSCS